jgi:hypothetical protein
MDKLYWKIRNAKTPGEITGFAKKKLSWGLCVTILGFRRQIYF